MALKCEAFNMQYKFCYEDWLPKGAVKFAVDGLDQRSVEQNITLRKEVVQDTPVIFFEVRSSSLIDDLSKMPYEMRHEAMEQSLGQVYAPILVVILSEYFMSEKGKSGIKTDSTHTRPTTWNDLSEWIVGMKYRFDVLSDKGKLSKKYDLTDYVFDTYLKVSKQAQRQKAEESASEMPPDPE